MCAQVTYMQENLSCFYKNVGSSVRHFSVVDHYPSGHDNASDDGIDLVFHFSNEEDSGNTRRQRVR